MFKLLSCLILLHLIISTEEQQLRGTVTQRLENALKLGSDIKLSCSSSASQIVDQGIYWFRQRAGKPPECLVFITGLGKKRGPCGEHDSRITVGKSGQSYNLVLAGFQKEDAAMYYCVSVVNSVLYFGSGTNVVINEPSTTTVKITTKKVQTTETASKGNEGNQCGCANSGSSNKPTERMSPKDLFACELYIWIPLAAISVLLVISLIITLSVGKKSRRRICKCKNHYKNRPTPEGHGRPQFPDRYI
ncbi:T-cell surface glycoprotein CD8 alpha chain [Protopterus annectens]|uniref:T-cell surface glycoprotein CD8 alpha chain n=1 Tax=Protopterus annectens TaxID=7888 RepID=UPI001CFAB4DA|nr:T-cell surface glycoprotein CD8 alpha chain [Protopterus annectens]